MYKSLNRFAAEPKSYTSFALGMMWDFTSCTKSEPLMSPSTVKLPSIDAFPT